MNKNYSSPFSDRYCGAVAYIFSDHFKYTTWRKLWLILAEAEKKLGVNITDAQIKEMRDHLMDIDMERAKDIECVTHHDVMAHLKLFGECCPTAAPIMHLGATSCYISDNTEVHQMDCALVYTMSKLYNLAHILLGKANDYKHLKCVGYTHFQRAQLTTIGKRFVMWARDIMDDIDRVDYELDHIEYLGCKGAVGTMASFVSLFNGDVEKAVKLDEEVSKLFPFPRVAKVTGQTYSRKQDDNMLHCLSGICQSASKFANDIRLLSNTGEIMEGFESGQTGSSAMPYKRNPISCEKMVSLSRYVMSIAQSTSITVANQWLERSLDDSACRRVIIPEAFIATNHILDMYMKVLNELVVNVPIIEQTALDHMPDGVSEEVLMYAVNVLGMDRNDIHGKIKNITTQGETLDVPSICNILGVCHDEDEAETILSRYTQNAVGVAVLQVDTAIKEYEERLRR